ncbi:MAG TPA: hypothetical protein VFE23_07535 [Usitatibacter sp.]|jgi:hypothetical protein|nr:hypothetical protein [Usitatibacter sp.]
MDSRQDALQQVAPFLVAFLGLLALLLLGYIASVMGSEDPVGTAPLQEQASPPHGAPAAFDHNTVNEIRRPGAQGAWM